MSTLVKRDGSGREKSQARAFGLASWFVLALAVVLLWGAAPAEAAFVCTIDVNGANDPPGDGQKDITQFCQDAGPGNFELAAKWNWDEITHNNGTSDACVLLDTDSDGFVDNAVCMTIQDSVNLLATRVFSCDNSKTQNCGDPTEILNPASSCTLSISNDDPFPAGDASPQDTEALCDIEIDDFGAASLGIVDVCSYPSASPASNASDCVLLGECAQDSDCDDANSCNGEETCVNDACVPGDPLVCDDGLFCNGDETCDAANGCQAGTAVVCTDGVNCTADACDEANDTCMFVPSDAFCANGDFCDGDETCDVVNDCQAGTASNCNDGVSCTNDSCNEGTDSCDNVADNSICANGDFCDGDETCDVVNDCQAGTAPNCNDGVACTDDSCNEGTNSCDNGANDANCANGDFCDGDETCDVVNDCQAGTAPNCNDGVACTDDSCNEGTNSCDNGANDANCANGDFCDGDETCDVVNDCQAGTAPNCNDGVACTDDSCNEGTNSCDNGANDANCANGDFCDGDETCDVVNDCQAGTAPNCNDGVACTDDSCNEGTDSCDNGANDANCANGDFCDGDETCDVVNDCQAGTAPNCNDGVACTDDSCNEGTNSCDNGANDANCANGDFCDGDETCDVVNDCQAGTAPNCNDGVACTDDSCNEGTNSCDNGANDANCANGDFCDGDETCDVVNDCQAGTAPNCNDGVACTDDSCNEGTDSCDNGANDANCANADFCDGDETCDVVNDCQAGTAPNCNDGVACTDDSCNEGTDSCDNGANDANCANGDFCDGDETCDVVNDCQAGTAPNCDDGVACTDDSCNEGTNSCDNGANDANCANADFCDGDETCDVVNDCQAGTAPDCDDGVACTDDSCNEGTDSCDNGANDANCANADFCDGDETCDVVNDCQAGTPVVCGGDLCNNGACNETSDMCDLTPTNDGGLCGDDTDNICTDPDTCEGGVCQPNNEPCASVTDSALCLFDVATKGVCVDGESLTGEVCDTTNGDADCSVGACVEEQQFRLLFTPDHKNWPSFKLNASNPGQFYYNLVSDKPGCVGGVDTESFKITIPFPFVTHGARPLHVYDGEAVGNAVGDDCFMPPEDALASHGLEITLEDWISGAGDGPENFDLTCPGIGPNMIDRMGDVFCTFEVEATYPNSCQLYVNVHLDYGLKGKDVDANPSDGSPDRYLPEGVLSAWDSQNALMRIPANGNPGGIAVSDCIDHTFSHEEDNSGFESSDTVQNLNEFKGVKGVLGLVQTSSTGAGVEGATVSLVHPIDGVVAGGQADEDGYYLVDYKHRGKRTLYTIRLEGESKLTGTAVLKANGFAEVNFDVTTGSVEVVQDDDSGTKTSPPRSRSRR